MHKINKKKKYKTWNVIKTVEKENKIEYNKCTETNQIKCKTGGKTMKKKLVSLLVVTAMIVGCMSGCGSENKKSDSAN